MLNNREELNKKGLSFDYPFDDAGGLLRYNRALGRLDAHCGAHLGSCKMDRSLRKGCIGLNLSWLQCSAENKTDHNVSKWTCSDSTGYEARKKCRDDFIARAEREGGVCNDILVREFDCALQMLSLNSYRCKILILLITPIKYIQQHKPD